MQLILWIGICCICAWFLRRHLTICLVLILVLWFLVPTVGSYLLTGQQIGPLSFHAATWFIVAVACAQFIQNPEALRQVISRHGFLFLLLALVFSVAFFTTRTVQSGGGMVLFVDQMLTPAIFFLLILAAAVHDGRLLLRLRNALLVLASIVVVVAIFQWATKSVIFYEAGFLTQFWFNPKTQRWMGTFDQPLALSLVLCTLAPLLAGIRRLWIALPVLALMLIGVAISQSRLGVVLVVVGVLYAVWFSRRSGTAKLLISVTLAVGIYLLLLTPLVAGILGRISDDTGSTEARNRAYGIFARDWTQYLFSGDGLTASYGVADFAGLQTSFESSIIMYAVDIGIIFAVLYFGALLAVVLRNAGKHNVPGLTLAGLLAVLIPQTYSGLATRSVAGIVVWAIVAMTVVAAEASQKAALAPGMRAAGERQNAGARSWESGKPPHLQEAGVRSAAGAKPSNWIGR